MSSRKTERRINSVGSAYQCSAKCSMGTVRVHARAGFVTLLPSDLFRTLDLSNLDQFDNEGCLPKQPANGCYCT